MFFVDYPRRGPARRGWLISGPVNSPENGRPGHGADDGPPDHPRPLRQHGRGGPRPGRRRGIRREARRDARSSIAPNQIGKHGQLQEWLEDKDDPEERAPPRLAPVGPVSRRGDHAASTPELFAAARQSLIFRGDGGTGWCQGVEDQLLGPAAWTATTPTGCSATCSRLSRPGVDYGKGGGAIPTSSTPIRRSRSTATSAPPPASRRCCCRATLGEIRPAARPAQCLADGQRQGPAGPRRLRGGHRLEGRQAHRGRHPQPRG